HSDLVHCGVWRTCHRFSSSLLLHGYPVSSFYGQRQISLARISLLSFQAQRVICFSAFAHSYQMADLKSTCPTRHSEAVPFAAEQSLFRTVSSNACANSPHII